MLRFLYFMLRFIFRTELVHRWVRQRETVSAKLFTRALENCFRTLNWMEKRKNVDDTSIICVIIIGNKDELEQLLTDLVLASDTIGLQMNYEKNINNVKQLKKISSKPT